MILVTAAYGNQGRLLVPKLLAAGLPVRACVQSPASAARLRALGVQDVVVGDIMRPEVLASAMDGVEKVYHVGPTLHPHERAMGLAVVDAARAQGVEHFVFSSVLHAITTDLVQHEIKRDVLTHSDHHAGATYELAGPGRYTAHELREIIAQVLERRIAVHEIDADTYLKAWVGDADPGQVGHQARVLRSISARYSSHDFVGNPNVLSWLLERPPTTFEQFVRREHLKRAGGGAS